MLLLSLADNQMATLFRDLTVVLASDRLTYLRNGLMWQQRATAEGIPLKGNFVWSAMDNFEWINGYGDRFGVACRKFIFGPSRPSSDSIR
jgi:beta-glucosidase/6-phospho-beta-glucosidase/beta-galactosidase